MTANELLQSLRAAGMQPKVVFVEQYQVTLKDQRAAWEKQGVVLCPYDPALYAAESKPRAERWK